MADIINPDFDNSRYQFFWENFHFDPDYIDIDLRLRFSYISPHSKAAKCWCVNILAYDSKSLTFSATEYIGGKVTYFNIRRIVASSVVDLKSNQSIYPFTGQCFKDAAGNSAYRPRPRPVNIEMHRPTVSRVEKATRVAEPVKIVAPVTVEKIVEAQKTPDKPSAITVVRKDLGIKIAFFSGVFNKLQIAMQVESLCKDLHSGAFFFVGVNEKNNRSITLKNTMVSDGIYHRGLRYDWSDFISKLLAGALPEYEPKVDESRDKPASVQASVPWVKYMEGRAKQEPASVRTRVSVPRQTIAITQRSSETEEKPPVIAQEKTSTFRKVMARFFPWLWRNQ